MASSLFDGRYNNKFIIPIRSPPEGLMQMVDCRIAKISNEPGLLTGNDSNIYLPLIDLSLGVGCGAL